MNVEIVTEAPIFLFWEYFVSNFRHFVFAVWESMVYRTDGACYRPVPSRLHVRLNVPILQGSFESIYFGSGSFAFYVTDIASRGKGTMCTPHLGRSVRGRSSEGCFVVEREGPVLRNLNKNRRIANELQ
jgi:hypothetical protein